MDLERVVKILDILGTPKVTISGAGWVRAHCPFARWTHAQGRDSFPSFAIRVDEDNESQFKCQACGRKGHLKGLVYQLEAVSKQEFPDLHKLVASDGVGRPEASRKRATEATFYSDKVKFAGITTTTKTVKKFARDAPPILPEKMLRQYQEMDLEVMLYLHGPGRKLTDETLDRWEIGWDEHSRRITIPIRDLEGQLVGVSRRLFGRPHKRFRKGNGKEYDEPKYLHSKGFRRDFFLYGEHLIDKTIRHAYVTESFFDVMYLDQLGYPNALAIMGSYLSLLQKAKIEKFFDEISVVRHGDVAGAEMAAGIQKMLSGSVQVKVYDCPEGEDANSMSQEDLVRLLGPPSS